MNKHLCVITVDVPKDIKPEELLTLLYEEQCGDSLLTFEQLGPSLYEIQMLIKTSNKTKAEAIVAQAMNDMGFYVLSVDSERLQ